MSIVHLKSHRAVSNFVAVQQFPTASVFCLLSVLSFLPCSGIVARAANNERRSGPQLIVIFIIALAVMVLAPLPRRLAAPLALAGGACLILLFSLAGLLRVDPRIGAAAIESNRKEYLFFIVCEAPVLILALLSRTRFRWAFWVGWGINAAVSLFVLWVFIELTYFWHW